MKPYPRNNINFDIVTPIYIKNTTLNDESRYSIYRELTNFDFPALEIKLTNSISKNETYKGFYYTTKKNENLYQIAKIYYNDESLWWVIAKANGLKNSGISSLDKGITLVIPSFSELTSQGGYYAV